MKPKTMILMVVAVTCGLGASYMTSRLLAERGAETEKVVILVAKKNLNMGDIIKVPEEMFVEKFVPKGDEPRLALVEFDKLKGRVLKRSLRGGDFVTPEDLLDDKAQTMDVRLPQGYRAVGIRVSADNIASGFASLPHSRVDIINTVRRGDDRSTYSEVILEDVLVLAADQQANRNENSSAMLASVVTVALKPEDALKLELAKSLGTISLVLRKFNDKSKTTESRLTVERLKTGAVAGVAVEDTNSEAPPPVTALPPLPTPKVEPKAEPVVVAPPSNDKSLHTLTIIEGDQQRKVNFQLDSKSNKVQGSEVQQSELSAPPPAAPPTPPAAEATPAAPASVPPAPAAQPKRSEPLPDDGDL